MPLRRSRRRGCAGVLALVVLVLGLGAAPATAEPRAAWTSGVVRFEPAAGAAMAIEGLGSFRGAVELRPGAGGVTVVNEVGFEDYVRGIQEVPTSWPAAALEAQAVAARTFALRTMLVPPSGVARAAGAHICATESCQVYRGLTAGLRDGGAAWARAVTATAGRVLLHRGSPILAKYSSSNGGRSESGGAPYLPLVEDPDDLAVSPWARWQSVIPLDQVARALPGPGGSVELERSGDVVVARRRQPDGALVDQGYSGASVRSLLNRTVATPPGVPVPLPSQRFVARTEEGRVVFDGGGYGHLLGMSQYGALGKARRGLSADDILAAYYGGLRPTAVAAERLPATIRVVLSVADPSVTVSSTGRFRVVAADGANIAHLAGGSWTARPAADGVEVTTATPGAAQPQVSASALGPQAVRLVLAVPSVVVLRDRAGATSSLGLLDVGTHDVPVPAPPPEGTTTEVTVEADAGGGRLSRALVPVAGPTPAPAAPVQVGALASADTPLPPPTVAASVLRAPAAAPGRALPVTAAASALALAWAATTSVLVQGRSAERRA